MELILIRHARPEQIEKADGPADPSLTELGHRQAQALAGWLAGEPFDALYVSPMARAVQTAEPLARLFDIKAIIIDGIREYDALDPSYVPLEVLRQDKARWQAFLAEEETQDRLPFIDLVRTTIEAIVDDHPGQRVLIVCHGGVINAWATETLGIGSKMFFNPDYTSINRFLAASTGERSILSLNETGHLRGAPDLRL